MIRKTIFGTASALLVLAALSSCATSSGGADQSRSGSDGSRAKLYTSTAQLLGDTDLVVVGTAGKPTAAAETDTASAHTVTPVTITSTIGAKGVGPLANTSSAAASVGSVIAVRQLGTSAEGGDAAAALLQEGKTYLLFLTPSGLPGADAAQYYPVGGTAGVWTAGGSAAFSRLVSEGDKLPASLTARTVATTTPAPSS